MAEKVRSVDDYGVPDYPGFSGLFYHQSVAGAQVVGDCRAYSDLIGCRGNSTRWGNYYFRPIGCRLRLMHPARISR
jgi:hypothetical protein